MEAEELLPPEVVKAVVDLGRLSLAFGRVDRVTYHEDRVTPESDTDHTVMLGLVATAYADRYATHLDKGLIAQFALVHDLVEVYAGDTATVRTQSEEAKQEKKEREDAALARIRAEFDAVFPWIGETIEKYERLDTPEACFVKFVDKVLPKITHMLTAGKTLEEHSVGEEDMKEIHRRQYESISATYGADLPEVRQLYASMSVAVRDALFGT